MTEHRNYKIMGWVLLLLLAALWEASGSGGLPEPSPLFRQKMANNPHRNLGRTRARPTTTLKVTDFGGDPTGQTDSAAAFDTVLAEAWRLAGMGRNNFTDGPDLGGVVVDLEGGQFGVTRPIVFPLVGGGTVRTHPRPPHRSPISRPPLTVCTHPTAQHDIDADM